MSLKTITTNFEFLKSSRAESSSRLLHLSPWVIISGIITLFVITPIAFLALGILNPTPELWEHMMNTFLPRALSNTLWLVGGVGLGTFIIGTGFAWLVTAYDFPGRRWFEHLLLLPLAVPTFVMGFVFIALLEYAGPVQTFWRNTFGAEAFFPDIYSRGGVIVVMTLVLYPYVYILSRAAFRDQSASTMEAARMMGYNGWQTFTKLVLPLARPSIAAGVILAMMEALTDFGAVQFFDYPTISERIVVLWNRTYDYGEATQLAGLLLVVAVIVVILERLLRGRAKYYQQGCRGRRMRRIKLEGWHKWGAITACVSLLSMAFFIPALRLITWAIKEIQNPTLGNSWQTVYMEYVGNTILLSGVAATVVVFLAVLIAYGARRTHTHGGNRFMQWLTRFVTMGYAMPGSVIAIGVLTVVNPLDGSVTDFAETLGRTDPSYLLTGTIAALTYAYVVRFMAVGFNSVESSLEKVTPSMEHAARTLGAKPTRVLRRIHIPLLSSGIGAGAILVFVDAMKELPATLLLRPFGMDTLALWTYFLAMESFWAAAAIPSLTIVAVGLIPVFLLMRLGDNHTDVVTTD